MILTKKNIYIATIITFLGLIVFGVLVVFPYVQDIFAISHDIKEQKLNVEDFDLKEENFKKLKEDEGKAKSTLNNLSKALVSKENSLELIVLLEEVAGKTSNIQAIEVVNKLEDEEKNNNKRGDQGEAAEALEDPLKNIEALDFKVRLEGSYKNLLLYLAELESLEVYTEIMSMEIKSSSISPTSSNRPFEEEIPATDIIQTTLEIRAFAK